MTRRSSVAKLPQEIRDWIFRLRDQGLTYDQILAKLRELDTLAVPVPSRSALHRHMQEAEKAREMVARQRVIAEAMVKELGEADDGRIARGNIAMMHTILTRVQVAALAAAESGDGTIDFAPAELMALAKTMDHLGKAAKDDVARTLAIERRAHDRAIRAAATAAADAAQDAGLSPERAAEVRRKVLGVRRQAPNADAAGPSGPKVPRKPAED